MGRVLVGVTSWTEKTLIASGRFYPPGVRGAEERLRFYASRFPVTEVDSSFYGLPSERNAGLWAARTPAEFVFDIKAFRLFTHHPTPLEALPADLRAGIREALAAPHSRVYLDQVPEDLRAELWRRFRSALEPLRAAGKLGVVLFQFPPWFVWRRAHRTFLDGLRALLPEDRIAIEFRHRSWFSEAQRQTETLALLRAHALVHVTVDAPQDVAASVPPVWASTAPLAVVRLHGRNRATWQARNLASAAERFDYLYSTEELADLVAPVCALAQQVETVHVLFNNCRYDYAPRNATQFQTLLDQDATSALTL